ncbi:polyadenylation and cleavage factor homolog 11-like [Oppia nitens]|uniref:polyadenylation and cleavage factor homolog 11-like n=1 Tax=Oppia nitens TaxID=1686743 RepID=UPI0023DA6F4A|nr:polyadenylation and cleavage factor homolog 11-like [Oppia nitens]
MDSSEVDSDLTAYKSELNGLTFNSKPLINLLTMLSEDYKDTKAPQIVSCIEHRLHEVSNDKKLPILYLLDSIIKNVGNTYVNLFTQNIVSTFCDVFEKVDEKTRLSLYKLRQTWADIFHHKKLYAIDVRIHNQLDPAWPITAPKPDITSTASTTKNTKNSTKPLVQSGVRPTPSAPQQQVHINPKFFNDPNRHPTISSGPDSEMAKQLLQKQNEILQLQEVLAKQKVELDKQNMNVKRKHSEDIRVIEEEEKNLLNRHLNRPNSPNGKKVKKRKRSQRSPSPSSHSSSQKSRSSPHRWNSNERVKGSPQPVVRSNPSYTMRQNNHRPTKSLSPNNSKAFLPQQNTVTMPPIISSAGVHTSKLLPSQPTTVPTTIPAPTILAQPEMLNITSTIESNVSTSLSSIRAHPSHISVSNVISSHSPNPIESMFIPWGQDRDYRKDTMDSAMMTAAHEKLRMGAISSADHDILTQEVERQIMEMHKINLMNNVTTPVVNEPNDTFTMLVDGKLRKIFYLDDSVAVVLLNAPPNAPFSDLINVESQLLDPRQISFEGKPTKVFYDCDRGCHDFIYLEFGCSDQVFYPITVPCPQRIKFGGPAKEIILNGQSYAAKFGGPPIQVKFDGDSIRTHTIQLDGPTPRVKLSDDRKFDLWQQIKNKATSGMNTMNNTSVIENKSTDVSGLLSRLIAAGFLNNTSAADKNDTNNSSNNNNSNNNNNDNIINNNNSNDTNDGRNESKTIQNDNKKLPKKDSKKESKRKPEIPIELTSDSLKIIRPNVVSALYNGIQCTNCSLRFDEDNDQTEGSDKTRYAKHLDWHFRQNRREKTKPNSNATSLRRNWFYPLNLWIHFNEVTEEDETTLLFHSDKEKEMDTEEEEPIMSVKAEKDESLNFCAVCREKFDQNWSEEEEEWRLNNAVKYDNKIYHPFCYKDLLTQQERMERELTESINDDKNSTINTDKSLKSEDINSGKTNSDILVNNLQTVMSDSETVNKKSEQNVEEMETSVNEIIDTSDVINNKINESTDPTIDDIKVIEFEIPLNVNNEINHQLVDNMLETKELIEENKEENVNNKTNDAEVSEDKIVLQQGGFVIKMKASNLQTQTTAQSLEPMETSEPMKSDVIVKGKEMSSLCNIL